MTKTNYWDNLIESAYTGSEELDFAGSYLTASEKEEEAYQEEVKKEAETRMAGKSLGGTAFKSVRGLTDKGRAATAVKLPVDAGTKVAFVSNAGSVLAYESAPDPEMEGVVVKVKSASGEITSHDGKVFVRFADGELRSIYAEHLRYAMGTKRKAQASGRIRVASLGDLTDFLRIGSDTLVHKATQDLWSLSKDTTGFVIERLFDDNGSPIKV